MSQQEARSRTVPDGRSNCDYAETFYVEYYNNTYGPFEHRCALPKEHGGMHRCKQRKAMGEHAPESPAIIFDLLVSPNQER